MLRESTTKVGTTDKQTLAAIHSTPVFLLIMSECSIFAFAVIFPGPDSLIFYCTTWYSIA